MCTIRSMITYVLNPFFMGIRPWTQDITSAAQYQTQFLQLYLDSMKRFESNNTPNEDNSSIGKAPKHDFIQMTAATLAPFISQFEQNYCIPASTDSIQPVLLSDEQFVRECLFYMREMASIRSKSIPTNDLIGVVKDGLKWSKAEAQKIHGLLDAIATFPRLQSVEESNFVRLVIWFHRYGADFERVLPMLWCNYRESLDSSSSSLQMAINFQINFRSSALYDLLYNWKTKSLNEIQPKKRQKKLDSKLIQTLVQNNSKVRLGPWIADAVEIVAAWEVAFPDKTRQDEITFIETTLNRVLFQTEQNMD